jgi:hypothetical protein
LPGNTCLIGQNGKNSADGENTMKTTNAAKHDPQDRRWGRIGIAAVAAAKCVKPREDKPARRDATLRRLLDSASE